MDFPDLPRSGLNVRTVLVARILPGILRLDAAESHHVLRVIRLPRGGTLRVCDGAGQEAIACLVGAEAGLATLNVGPLEATPAPAEALVLLGVPRPALVEEAVTLGTEAGATAFWLIRAARSLPGEVRLDRVERVISAAIKQCGRSDRPNVRVFASVREALNAGPGGARFLAAPGGASPSECWGAAGSGVLALSVGPEGGWAIDEVDAFLAANFVPVSLGSAILRAPTAVAVGLAALHATR